MKKKDYQKPTMQVVKLQRQAHLLQASGQAGVQNYDWNDEVTE
jgi:hypothetical protein